MDYQIDFSIETEQDLELIFDFLFKSYRDFNIDRQAAFDQAARRIEEILTSTQLLEKLPERGVERDDISPNLRMIVIDKTIFYYDVLHEDRKVRILGIFLNKQDHCRWMLLRLLADDKAPG